MLEDKIEKAMEQVERKKNIKQHNNTVDNFNQAIDEVNKSYSDLKRTLDVIIAVKNKGIFIHYQAYENNDLVKKLEFCKNAITKCTLNSDKVETMMSEFYSYKKRLNIAWKNDIGSEILSKHNMLEVFKAFSINQNRINELLQHAKAISSEYPTNIQDVKKISIVINKIDNEINMMQYPDDIADFIRTIHEGKATLGDLNNNIFLWFHKNNLLSKIGLHINL